MHWPIWRVAVAERSMEPALRPGDWLLVWRGRGAGRPLRIRPGQIVIAVHPGNPDLLLVKRAARRELTGWWLASDNSRVATADSRTFGPVPVALIEGRVLLRYGRVRHRQPATKQGGPDGSGPP